ncbi:bifunctional diguanylate cyclase/phosphodiesterase [Aliiroseovarius sp. M344]|uniref:putative bifunctional diguanylate cyclase/phosphodiesterase n=1 Tax=Aliiroseovarius sp. M344 TaxID=2867010 RepID=UPI0021ADE132|nr:bifunctional diguanylate cyclase/phosphodiesterase [Aliiroseovarius sp. M344]UWQ14787.1 bifunctional diguanylate cyclase/phosphodiesterase [Aliiroseovarius sp. M344]
MVGVQGAEQVKKRVRAVLTAPHLAAFLPAIMIMAFWNGGENLMVLVAILFPGLLAIGGALTRPKPTRGVANDEITGLPRRPKLLEQLDRGFASDADFEKSCFVLEIDDIQKLSAQLGEESIRQVLRTIADRVKATLRETDLMCALNTGRFGISIDKRQRADLEATLQLAARLQAAVSEPISVDQTRVLLSSCVGFALPSRSPEATGEALLAAAESALGVAVLAGPGSIRAFSNGMAARVGRSEHNRDELSRALDAGEIRPWFQPQVSVKTGRVSGCEALVRWQHPTMGLIAPGAFLPAISKAGLMERLGEVVLFGALSALQDWDRQGLEIPAVAINISAEELNNPNLSEKIKWELDRFDMRPNRLVVEILENVIAQTEDDVARHNINALADLGCKIDLDDFGTGNASIASIARFNVHRIKIDRSFVTHIDTDTDQQNMISAILTIADQLDVGTVAEGVETHGEHTKLVALGCDHAQGYSIAKPMPAQTFLDWVKAHEPKLLSSEAVPRLA